MIIYPVAGFLQTAFCVPLLPDHIYIGIQGGVFIDVSLENGKSSTVDQRIVRAGSSVTAGGSTELHPLFFLFLQLNILLLYF